MSEPSPSWKQPPNFLSLCCIALLAAVYLGPFADLDYTWQIRTGEQIVSNGRLRTVDSFTYTINGRSLPDFEWLYEVALWAVWTTCGVAGLKLLKTFLVITPLLLLARQLRREGIRWPGIALCLFVALIVVHPSWNLRPLYCSTIGLLLVTCWLHEHCIGRRPLSWGLPVVMLLWSNLHPGVIMGQALLMGAIGWEWLNRWVKLNPPLEKTGYWRLTAIGSLGLAATFLSPDPIERLLYPFHPEVSHPIMRIFMEMQPIFRFIGKPPYGVMLTYLVALAVGLSVLLRFRFYRFWQVSLLLVLAVLANAAYRSLQDWLLVMLVLGVPHIAALARGREENLLSHTYAAWERALSGAPFRFQWFWPTSALALFTVISFVPALARHVPNADRDDWPQSAVNWIEAQGLQGRFFAPPNYGTYLEWRLGERARSYVDTRGFFFPPELIEDSHYLPQLAPDWRSRLNRVFDFGTDYFLLEPDGLRGGLWQMLKDRVGEPLYVDEQAVLLSSAQVRDALRLVPASEELSCLDAR